MHNQNTQLERGRERERAVSERVQAYERQESVEVRACLSNSCSYVYVCMCVYACRCMQNNFLPKFFSLCVCVCVWLSNFIRGNEQRARRHGERERERESTVCCGDSDCSQLFARSLKRVCVSVCVLLLLSSRSILC